MSSEAQKKASKRYNAKNTVRVVVTLNKNTDRDIIHHLDGVESKAGYVKELIRNDLLDAECDE